MSCCYSARRAATKELMEEGLSAAKFINSCSSSGGIHLLMDGGNMEGQSRAWDHKLCLFD